MSQLPCPQAAASYARPTPPYDPWITAIEVPRSPPRPDVQPDAQPVPPVPQPIVHRWPYHLPQWNALDTLWWTMLARASYASTDQWVRAVAGWAGAVSRLSYVAPTNPAVIGFALVELPDHWLCVVPGTSSDAERNAYIITHAMALQTRDPDGGWLANSTWYLRAAVIWVAAAAWPYPPAKPLLCVGHSAGGAEGGLVAFYRVGAAPVVPVTTVSLGSPRWGTESLRSYAVPGKNPTALEMRIPGDPISLLPPPWTVRDLFNLPFLGHERPEYVRLAQLLDLTDRGALPAAEQLGAREQVERAVAGALTGQLDLYWHRNTTYTAQAVGPARTWGQAHDRMDLVDPLLVILADMIAAGVGD